MGEAARWVMFISGLVRISLPDDNSTITGESSVYITGGEFGLIFASDVRGTSERGHRTQYPGLTETVALGIPTADGQIPEHEVLHMGPCTTGETTGIRAFA
jgi:hypothetical protein